MYIDEPMLNPIWKFEPESNLELAEPEHEPEPCDIGYIQPIQPWGMCIDQVL